MLPWDDYHKMNTNDCGVAGVTVFLTVANYPNVVASAYKMFYVDRCCIFIAYRLRFGFGLTYKCITLTHRNGGNLLLTRE